MKPALLLVDLQNDFLREPGLEPHPAVIVAQAAELLATWREAGLPVVHLWTTIDPQFDTRMPHWQKNGRRLCVAGTEGHATPGFRWPRDRANQ